MADRNIPASSSVAAMVNLPRGKPLTASESSLILRAAGAPVIVLAGAAGSGKTTLLATLHDSFQRGPFAGYLAAGSETLIGFEERCFDSRFASGLGTPSTQRTTFEEGQLFYHMRLRKHNLLGPFQNLLLADMSGEHYERAIDSAVEAATLESIVRRADQFVHLVDAEKLGDRETRAHTRSNASMLMRRFFELGFLSSDSRIDVLLTKWDLVLARGGDELCRKVEESAMTLFGQQCAKRVSRFRLTPVAVRPHYKSPLPFAYGLDALFQSWVDERVRQLEVQSRRIPLRKLVRPFECFALSEAKEMFEVMR